MFKEESNSIWSKCLKKHIQVYHEKSGNYKTTLIVAPHLYRVVTRVNFLTVKLWMEHVNAEIKTRKLNVPVIDKVNWMVLNKGYRRDFQKRLSEAENAK